MLEAALRRDLHDEHTWAVLGDLLTAEGDARGELIALEQRAGACERPFEKAVLEHRAAELFDREHRAWLGPLADAGLEVTWMRGFATEVVIGHRHTSTLAKLLALPSAALLRKLVFVQPRNLSGLAAALADCPIERLELRFPAGRELESLAPLASLVQLRELIVEGGDTTELDALAELPRLESLALRRSTGPLTGLDGGFAALRSLDLSARANVGALGRDPLTAIAGLSGLERLSLHDGGWSHLGPIAQLCSLVHLDLRSTDVASIAPLAGLAGLETLDLSGCTEITNIDVLAQLVRLTRLEIAYTRVRRIQPLGNLRALEFLDLSGTPVRDLSPLFNLPALRKIGLEACEIDNLAPLRQRGVVLVGVRAPEPTWRDLAEGLLQRSRERS